MSSAYASALVFAIHFIKDEVLGDDDVAFRPDNFGDVGDFAAAVTQTGCLNDHIDRTNDHFANGSGRQVVTAHGDHAFKPA